jgi:hypothetical protein
MIHPIACPCCLHEETIRARCAARETGYDDDLALMRWNPPQGGARAQVADKYLRDRLAEYA